MHRPAVPCITHLALLLAALLRVTPDAIAQGDSERPQASVTVPGKLLRAGSNWALRFALPGAANSQPGDLVPVSIQPAVWISGKILPGGLVELPLTLAQTASLLPGTNRALAQLPGWRYAQIEFDSAPALVADKDLRDYAALRMNPVPLPGSTKGDRPLQADPALPGLSFRAESVALDAPVSPAFVSLPCSGSARRVYLLAGCSRGARPPALLVTVRTNDGIFKHESIRIAAAPHWAGAAPAVGGGLQWRVAIMDLEEAQSLESITLAGDRAPVRVAAITLAGPLKPGAWSSLPARLRALAPPGPLTIFGFDKPGLSGWEITGGGWGTTDSAGEPFMRKGRSRYFADSKAVGGEPATGTILSAPFTVSGTRLTFLANGHGAKNHYALVDAVTGAELRRAPAPEKTGPFVSVSWDVTDLRGRKVRFKAVDADGRTAYAWIAFDAIELLP